MIWLRAVVILDSQRVSAHIHHQFERRVAIFRGFTPRTTLIIHPSQSLRNGAATKRLRLQLSALHKGPGDSGGVIEEHQIVCCLLARVFANNIVYNFLMKINAWLFCICPFPQYNLNMRAIVTAHVYLTLQSPPPEQIQTSCWMCPCLYTERIIQHHKAFWMLN